MTERIYRYTRGNCGYAGGYIISNYSYSTFRWGHTGYCDCGWNTGAQLWFNDAENLIMNHATLNGWGVLAFSWTAEISCFVSSAADLEKAKRDVVSRLRDRDPRATDAQALVWGFDTLIAFATS